MLSLRNQEKNMQTTCQNVHDYAVNGCQKVNLLDGQPQVGASTISLRGPDRNGEVHSPEKTLAFIFFASVIQGVTVQLNAG